MQGKTNLGANLGKPFGLSRRWLGALSTPDGVLDINPTEGSSPSPPSQLGLARAYAMSGDSDKSRTAYQEFFTLCRHFPVAHVR